MQRSMLRPGIARVSASAAIVVVYATAEFSVGLFVGVLYGVIRVKSPAQAGVRLTSWIQILLEFQRDWTRHETYEVARNVVVANGGGYGMGLAYAREMIHPG